MVDSKFVMALVVGIVILLVWYLASDMLRQQSSTQQQHPPLPQRVYGDHHHFEENKKVAFKILASGDSSSSSPSPAPFRDFVFELVHRHLGPHLSAPSSPPHDGTAVPAVFDLDLLHTLVSLPCQKEAAMHWDISLRRALPAALPSCLSSWAETLSTLKVYSSLALSKLAHDATLNELHVALLNAVAVARQRQQQHAGEEGQRALLLRAATSALHEFRFATARVVSAHVHHVIAAIQTAYDGFRPANKQSGAELAADFASAPISARIATPRRSGASSASTSSSSSSSSTSSVPPGLARWLRTRITRSVESILTPHTPHFERQAPLEGKFWNIVRAELGCATLERSCENPEGCRYLCNREYLLRSGHARDSVAVLEAVFGGAAAAAGDGETDNSNRDNDSDKNKNVRKNRNHLQLVSFGSNNEYDWEDSMVTLAQRSGVPLAGVATFDCTLVREGPRPSPLMKALEKDRLFKFFPFCIGSAADGRSVISFAELQSLLNHSFSSTSSSKIRQRQQQQPVSVLKMDIESFEFVAVPRWLQRENQLAVSQATTNQRNGDRSGDKAAAAGGGGGGGGGGGRGGLVDFTALSSLASVEQLQTEIHRRGHKNKRAAGFAGAMWLQWLLLNYHALGFLAIKEEKNHVDGCCFEAVFVHQRFFVSSQAWHTATTVV